MSSSSQKRKRTDESPLTRQDTTLPPTASSLLQDSEDVSFPRGGASALTPLELKQVANEAASDVLFATSNGPNSAESERPKKKKKTNKNSNSTATKTQESEESSESVIEHITFRNLPPGTLLLGQISEVNKHDLCVSFTDGIHGYVSLANISEGLTKILESLDEDMDDEKEDEEENESEEYDSDAESGQQTSTSSKELPDLHNFFRVGQWLRCSVVTNTALEDKKKQKRIELSIEPQVVNQLTDEDLSRSCVLQCSVKSIEDHGAILDVGVEGVTGFISRTSHSHFGELLPGAVFLANVAKKSGRTVTVNQDFSAKNNKISQISSIDAVIPGQVIDFLCQHSTANGIVGKAFGLVSGFLGISQQAGFYSQEGKESYAVGTNVKARIVATVVYKGEKCILVSELPHILSLECVFREQGALDSFPVGYIFEECTVLGRDSQYFYLAMDNERIGQVHISKVGGEEPSGQVKARVLGYNGLDGYYQLSTDPKVLGLQYLRVRDIPLGDVISACEITSVSDKGIHLSLFGGQFKGFVPPLHISDIKLVYPERKFKIGSKVKALVLNIDYRGHLVLSLKKSLVNLDEEEVKFPSSFKSIEELSEKDSKIAGTVEAFKTNGCLVSFLGRLKGFLPSGEISEAFVRRPQDHLRLGQTVIVKVLQHNEEQNRIIVTCKVSSEAATLQKKTIEDMIVGRSVVNATIVEKTKDSAIVELNGVGLRGVIYVGHLSDSRIEQNRALLKKLRIGSDLTGLVIDKDTRTRVFNLSCKKTLIRDAEDGVLPLTFEDIRKKDLNEVLHGYVKSISDKGVFVAFNGKFVGLVLPSYAVDSRDVDITKKFYVNQSVNAYLLRTDDENERFLLSFKTPKSSSSAKVTSAALQAINPVDASIKELSDFVPGKVTKAVVKAVKKNQLNVTLAENMHGRIDVSEVFDDFNDIKSTRSPLSNFKKGDVLDVKVIGFHDVKTHKFLPISHRSSKNILLELTMKPSCIQGAQPLSINDLKVGDKIIGFVNNVSKGFLWLTVSPTIKAKVPYFDLTDDSSAFSSKIEDAFPLGSALEVTVTGIDLDHNVVIVTGRTHTIKEFNDIEVDAKLPARILKVADNYLLLDLGNDVKGVAFVTDALDEYSKSLKDVFEHKRNDIVSAKVIYIDKSGEKINLSLRSDNPQDRDIKSHEDLKRGDVVRGFIKKVTDKGVFVYLSRTIQAFVPVSKLTDSYIKDWKKFYKPMQPVVGKVVNCEDDSHILITLKESEVNGSLNILKGYSDIEVGDIFEGMVKNVTDFGIFVKLNNTLNVTGLAHRSQIADTEVGELGELFGEGDKVKAIVLKVNPAKKQLSLGLKASYFKNVSADNTIDEEKRSDSPSVSTTSYKLEADDVVEDVDYNEESDSQESEEEKDEPTNENVGTLSSTGGLSLSANFDWTTNILDQARDDESSEEEDVFERKKPRNKKKQDVRTEDLTVDINTRAPESVGDFERLIMGNPNSSIVWMNYMAFQLQLGEIDKARDVAERALKTINFRDEAEKLNIWIAMLNLENTFGSEVTLEEVFKRACQYMDSYTMHNKLVGIYQASHKQEKAAALFKIAAKKFGSEKVSLWVSWGEFLIEQGNQDEAHLILSRALTSLPKRDHIEVVRKFAQLEFSKGDPEQGRSLFEGLLADTPKRIDLWNVYIDQEIKKENKKNVEDLFERVLSRKITRKQAKFFFAKWLQFEESHGDEKAAEYVKAKAAEYVEKHSNSAAE
ncbi:LAFE_0E06656g1_1 [Lachancea fermentati]|uniref:rRNA biogenesis protein RRP5 n=1 Tax=Lachancea fermentati TaxID=4955 RepID=A0A1G4MD95_LACFM|nr:LAFE_0E06656g1_1 [Lachancea fermentati]